MRINLLLAPGVLVFLLSCGSEQIRFSRIEYYIPDNIRISGEPLKKRFNDIETDGSSPVYLVVVLYSYSSGAERISFSEDGSFKTSNAKGRIKALVKVMNGKKIIRAEFIEAAGDNEDELISALAKGIKLRLVN